MKLIVDDNSKQHVRCFFHMLRVRQLRRFVDDNVIHTLWFELWYSHGWTTVIVDAICLLYIKSTPAAMSARCSRQACCVMHHHVLTLVLFCSSFTVCLSPVVFNTNYVCWCLTSTTILHHPTCWDSASVVLTVVFALQPIATSSSPWRPCASQTDPLLWQVQRHGTPYDRDLRSVICKDTFSTFKKLMLFN